MKEIVQDGTLVLRESAQPLPEELFGSRELDTLLADMAEALDREIEGVAIAAPQIAVGYRVFIVRKDRTLPPPPLHDSSTPPDTVAVPPPEIEVYINPEVVKTSRKRVRADEGCLSVRGVYGVTHRHERVTLRARRADGSRFERGASGIMAQIFEHEMDHLNGILFIDHAENLVHVRHASAS